MASKAIVDKMRERARKQMRREAQREIDRVTALPQPRALLARAGRLLRSRLRRCLARPPLPKRRMEFVDGPTARRAPDAQQAIALGGCP